VIGDRADRQALHARHLGDDVGSHLAGADQADTDRLARLCALGKVAGKPDGRDIRRHRIQSPVGVAPLDRFGPGWTKRAINS
jgi:hypothetical protein